MIPSTSPPPLIRSKLYPPRLAGYLVVRGRLRDHLTLGSQGPLTLVCAPAGSGKSTVVSEWLASFGAPYGWVSLDERDNELDVFLEYVLAAVQDAFPAANPETRNLLDTRIPPPLATIARSLSNDFDQLDDDFLLVLDDYHLIVNPRVHELLLQLLRHPPSRLHLVVVTRFDPPWPLASLRARAQMTELRFPDLQFSVAESAELLRNVLGDALQHDDIAMLHAESEGWAAGLRLMTLVLNGHENGRPRLAHAPALEKDITHIGEYLLAEVLSRQAAPDQDRLLRMSILERFSAGLCEAVCTGGEEADAGGGGSEAWGREFLARLDHANLFVVPLDSRREFYRFHHLFQQFLAARLRERSSAAEIATLHRRASDWLADHDFVEEALAHALEAGETTIAARLVARHRHALYDHEQFARLSRWLRLLPANVKEQTPELLLAEARIATMNWRYTEAAVFLDRAESELDRRLPTDPDLDPLLGELATLRGILEFWDGDAERFLAGSRFALAVLPPDAGHLRGLAHTGIASGLYLLGDAAGAWAYLDQQLARQSPRLPVYAWLLQSQCFLHWLEGDLTNSDDAARRLLRVSEDLELSDHEAMAHYFLGVVHYARNELAAAKQHLQHAFAARFTMRLMWWSQAAGVLALTYLALDAPEDARETIEDAHAFLLEQHAVRILPNMGAFQAEVNRLQGKVVEASTWAHGVDPLPLTWSLAVVDPRLVQARVYLTQAQGAGHDRATQLLAELRDFCHRMPNRRLLMEIEVLEALLLARQGQTECALGMLGRVVLAAETDGWVRMFVDLGSAMNDLLVELAERGVASHYVAHLLAAFPTAQATNQPVPRPSPTSLVEPLSDRELEVLALLAQRLSNKEISAQLFIAAATVKQHTLSIYRKLAVNSRRQAVTKAISIGLLSPA